MACFHNFNKDFQKNHNPEDTPKRAVLTWKPESTHHRAQKSSEVLAAPGGKISKLLDMNTIRSVSHWDTAETHATSQRHHGGHVQGRFPDPRDKVTQWLPRDQIRGSGAAVGPGLVITLASPFMFPTLAPSPGRWEMGRPPFKGHSHQGSSGVLSGHAWSMPGSPWLEWPRHAAAHPPRPPLPPEPLESRGSPAMAWGSAEHSCTSTTQQSSAALSFFSLDADGATRKRPCRQDRGSQDSLNLQGMKAKRTGRDFPGGPAVRNPPANAGDTDSSPGPGRSHMPRSN